MTECTARQARGFSTASQRAAFAHRRVLQHSFELLLRPPQCLGWARRPRTWSSWGGSKRARMRCLRTPRRRFESAIRIHPAGTTSARRNQVLIAYSITESKRHEENRLSIPRYCPWQTGKTADTSANAPTCFGRRAQPERAHDSSKQMNKQHNTGSMACRSTQCAAEWQDCNDIHPAQPRESSQNHWQTIEQALHQQLVGRYWG